MLRVHTTAEGEKMFVSQMEDDHLKNTVLMIIRGIKDLKDALSMKITLNPFKSALYGVDTSAIAEKAKGKISSATSNLYPYLAEAMLRGMDFKAELQDAFERTGKEDKFGISNEPILLTGPKKRRVSSFVDDWSHEDDNE